MKARSSIRSFFSRVRSAWQRPWIQHRSRKQANNFFARGPVFEKAFYRMYHRARSELEHEKRVAENELNSLREGSRGRKTPAVVRAQEQLDAITADLRKITRNMTSIFGDAYKTDQYLSRLAARYALCGVGVSRIATTKTMRSNPQFQLLFGSALALQSWV